MRKDVANRSPMYQQYGVPEMDMNPLIAALNRPTDILDEQLDRLAIKPTFSEDERRLPSSVRTFLLNRLQQQFFFPSTRHIQIYKDIEAQVFGGYWSRNPMSTVGQRLVHNAGTPGPHIERTTISNTGVAATISFFLGLSGQGKTATMKRVSSALSKPVIVHSKFRGKPLAETQIVTLMRNCSDQPNFTLKAIAKLLADRADELLGVRLYGGFFVERSMSRTHHVAELRRILSNHWVGAVIIDVFENLSLTGTSGRDEFIATLANLRDELGMPIILVATYKSAQLLDAASASVTRRFVDGGFHDLKRPESSADEDFQSFCDITWKYQWLRNPAELSDEIREMLYYFSQGITAVFLLLFRFAQIEAIRSGDERIDAKTLKSTYMARLGPLHRILNALRSGNKAILDRYDDLYLPAFTAVESTGASGRLGVMTEKLKQGQQDLGLAIPEAKDDEPTNARQAMTAEQRLAEVMNCTTGLPTVLS